MTAIILIKQSNNTFIPGDAATVEYVKKLKVGELLRGDFARIRNVLFHRKFFSLIDLVFDLWQPSVSEWEGIPVIKHRERFRKDVTIMAGYRDVVVNIRGEVRYEAQSISFANMSQDEFDGLYSAFFNVCWQQILINQSDKWTKEELERVINQMESYA